MKTTFGTRPRRSRGGAADALSKPPNPKAQRITKSQKTSQMAWCLGFLWGLGFSIWGFSDICPIRPGPFVERGDFGRKRFILAAQNAIAANQNRDFLAFV